MAQDVYQLNIYGVVAGQLVENVLHYQNALTNSGTPFQDAADLQNSWQSAAELNYINCLPSDYTLLGYQSKRVNNSGGPTFTQLRTGITGLRPTAATATQVAVGLIASYFSNMGPKPRWRVLKMFLPSMAKDDIVDNKPVTLLETRILTFISSFTTVTGAQVWTLGVWSRKYHVFFNVGGVVNALKLYTQKKRLVPII